MTTIATQIRELQTLTAAELAGRYTELFGKPPRVRNKAFLQRHVAWKLQEREFGGLSDRAKMRLDELMRGIELRLGQPAATPRPRPTVREEPRAPMIGTTLTRRWHEQDIRVEVREAGFEWNGAVYRSLSAVAKAITGAAWNGRLFFGLTQRRTGA